MGSDPYFHYDILQDFLHIQSSANNNSFIFSFPKFKAFHSFSGISVEEEYFNPGRYLAM
jgi:hypothetical protein